jgi:hypothetical protein
MLTASIERVLRHLDEPLDPTNLPAFAPSC